LAQERKRRFVLVQPVITPEQAQQAIEKLLIETEQK
jgi:hypothetical protein